MLPEHHSQQVWVVRGWCVCVDGLPRSVLRLNELTLIEETGTPLGVIRERTPGSEKRAVGCRMRDGEEAKQRQAGSQYVTMK